MPFTACQHGLHGRITSKRPGALWIPCWTRRRPVYEYAPGSWVQKKRVRLRLLGVGSIL